MLPAYMATLDEHSKVAEMHVHQMQQACTSVAAYNTVQHAMADDIARTSIHSHIPHLQALAFLSLADLAASSACLQ